MNIELRPHVGKSMASGRVIDLQQDRIFVDGQHVGYVARQAGAPINLIYPDIPEDHIESIRGAVAAKYGGAANKVAAPVAIADSERDGEGDEFDADE